jgi:hypothetical protein
MELFLKFIFVVVVIYYSGLLFFRYGLPWLLARFIRKQQEKFFQQPPVSGSGNTEPKAKKQPKVKKKKTDDKGDTFGEYVDFEEIEDK